ncbi:molybdenum cofactor guanylyltransferase [Novosphingobium sp. TH158]|uniref:molybdenum cofactor guanylyltransferase n=1 Tax=Novosphingobium sp. TH158 TaxID=2067455 RepID=UPI000C7AB4FD|nr:NTP transferase domain-containing protein [Novosphingobium sp. TH158]PLK26954.1 molybdenum cofactor guanylyltransferase [Novosphingobium sp. TH158]
MTSPRILGVVLAGGQSRRFGSDKALALLDGAPLIDHAVAALQAWCDAVAIVGREHGPVPCLPDWPASEMGPLAGLCGALRHAREHGFDLVLSLGVDCPDPPPDLPGLLSPAPACLAAQPVIGLWPAVEGARAAEAILSGPGRHSMRALAAALDARLVELANPPANINFPHDLERAAGQDEERE